jgi:hypothetical protein
MLKTNRHSKPLTYFIAKLGSHIISAFIIINMRVIILNNIHAKPHRKKEITLATLTPIRKYQGMMYKPNLDQQHLTRQQAYFTIQQ